MLSEKIELNYPVLFVHGIAAHDSNKKISCWGRIPATLKENGVQVFFGNTEAWGDKEIKELKEFSSLAI